MISICRFNALIVILHVLVMPQKHNKVEEGATWILVRVAHQAPFAYDPDEELATTAAAKIRAAARLVKTT